MEKVVGIWTNAVDLAKHIMMLQEKNYEFKIELVSGIDGETVVKVTYWRWSKED